MDLTPEKKKRIGKLMADYKMIHITDGRLGWTVVALTSLAMFAAGVAMFVV